MVVFWDMFFRKHSANIPQTFKKRFPNKRSENFHLQPPENRYKTFVKTFPERSQNVHVPAGNMLLMMCRKIIIHNVLFWRWSLACAFLDLRVL